MKLKLVKIEPETSDVKSFYFDPPESISWQPGQYMHYQLPHPSQDDRGVERWFTISTAPFEKQIRITTRFNSERSSSFKQALQNLKIGSEIEADGPGGKFILVEGDHRHILIAGGIGITPYRSMLVQLDHDNAEIDAELLYANNSEELVFGDELQAIASRHEKFQIQTYIGEQARISDDELAQKLEDRRTIFYLSGPKAMVEHYQHKLEEIGAPEDRLKTDYFPGY